MNPEKLNANPNTQVQMGQYDEMVWRVPRRRNQNSPARKEVSKMAWQPDTYN